ncbi:hypothetical protein IWW56_000449 [Coemansia sp. RSA 2131]|nr:hypothetical protein IWW56_000449 [Coemansia sp. RSA 2131]
MAKPKRVRNRAMRVIDKIKQAHKAQAKAKAAPPKQPAKQPVRKPFFPYTQSSTILLIGEGNFSFAHSIATKLGTAANIVATAYDSELVARQKYIDVDDHIQAFVKLGGTVLFDVDGTQLDACEKLRGMLFSHIVFNFPHAGAGIKDQERNIKVNQQLLVGFFNSARPLLVVGTIKPTVSKVRKLQSDDDSDNDDMPAPKKRRTKGKDKPPSVIEFDGIQAQVVYDAVDNKYDPADEEEQIKAGEIHVALKSGLPYANWNIRQLARSCGLVTRISHPFNLDAYPGYEHRRTLGFKHGVSKDGNAEIANKEPKTHVFCAQVEDTDAQDGEKPKDKKTKAQRMLGVNSESFDGSKKGKRR